MIKLDKQSPFVECFGRKDSGMFWNISNLIQEFADVTQMADFFKPTDCVAATISWMDLVCSKYFGLSV